MAMRSLVCPVGYPSDLTLRLFWHCITATRADGIPVAASWCEKGGTYTHLLHDDKMINDMWFAQMLYVKPNAACGAVTGSIPAGELVVV
jgi:hypothetical protein